MTWQAETNILKMKPGSNVSLTMTREKPWKQGDVFCEEKNIVPQRCARNTTKGDVDEYNV